jgi:hypothetical protein
MRLIAFAVAIAFAAPAAMAQDAAQPAPAPVKEKKICRTIEATGTILGGKRECHTKREWAEMAARARDARQDSDSERPLRESGMGGRSQE